MKQRTHMIDVLFVLALFGVFAVSAMMVVVLGAGVYSNTVDSAAEHFDARTSLAYIGEKVRQSDRKDGVQLGSFGDGTALILEEEIEGDFFQTIIYTHEGTLREIFAFKGASFEPQDGIVIMETGGVDIARDGGLLRVTIADGENAPLSLTLCPRTLQDWGETA